MDKNFLQLLGHKPLSEIIADWHESTLTPEEDTWAGFPPKDFLNFVSSYPATPFDEIPVTENYIKPPSFLMVQAHRLWQTGNKVYNELEKTDSKKFIDLGSLPFFLPLLLRDYFGYKHEIIGTTNIDLSPEGSRFLEKKKIQVMKLDLDPYVSDPFVKESAESSGTGKVRLPFALDIETGSVDFILASHVIEHLYHPRSLVKECARLIRPGGKLMITTDNAMMIGTLLNYVAGYGYIFEPIENTAAMTFHFWRGHTRFFSDKELSKLAQSEGFETETVEYNECFYEVFFDEYFKKCQPMLSNWKRRLLKDIPWLRNDVTIIAAKGPALETVINNAENP